MKIKQIKHGDYLITLCKDKSFIKEKKTPPINEYKFLCVQFEEEFKKKAKSIDELIYAIAKNIVKTDKLGDIFIENEENHWDYIYDFKIDEFLENNWTYNSLTHKQERRSIENSYYTRNDRNDGRRYDMRNRRQENRYVNQYEEEEDDSVDEEYYFSLSDEAGKSFGSIFDK